MNIRYGVRFKEKRSHLFVAEASDAAADTRDEEDKFRMLLGIRDELIDVRLDRLQSSLHRRNGIALAGRSDTYTPFGTKLLVCITCCAASVKAREVTAEDEYLIRREMCDVVR